MRALMVVAVVTAGVISSVFGESTVVLKSGETLQGNIIFDTNDILRIEAHNANRTISYQRDISHDEIQSIQTDNPAQAAERADYEALSKFQLNPNQEQSIDYCSQVITAFQKFLTDYPKSDKSPAIQQRLGAWQSELKHVSDGEVKFGDKWMTPEEKQPLVEHWQKQMQVQAAQNTLESLKKQLRILQTKRDSLAESTAAAQGLLQAAQDQIKTLRDSQQPIYQTTTQPFQPYRDGQGHWIVSGPAQSSQSIVGYTTVPNPERATLQSEVSDYQRQVYSGPQALENLDAKIKVLEIQIPKAEQDCKIALAQLNPRPPPPSLPIVTQVVAKAELPPQPTPPPPTTAPPEPKPEPTSWYTRLWKWL